MTQKFTDPNGHVDAAFNLASDPGTLEAASPVGNAPYKVPMGPGELTLPPTNAPETISVADIRAIGQGIYDAGWGKTLLRSGR